MKPRMGAARLFSTSARAFDAAHKVVVIGGGSAGLGVSHRLLNSGKFADKDIAIVDPAEWHHYQPGWTLVGGGLKSKEDLARSEASLIDPKIKFYQDAVVSLTPDQNQVTTASGEKLTYDQLVVAPGYTTTLDKIRGLPAALQNEKQNVVSIYTYDTVDKVFPAINRFKEGRAIFTQPGSPIKCAGAPQKIMWLALDHWSGAHTFKAHDPSSPIKIDFATGMPTMFSVPKYSEVLNQLREERGVGGYFKHNLVAIEDKTAVFNVGEGKEERIPFDFLHVTPTMSPPAFLKNSPIADAAGYAEVKPDTLQQTKYSNIWAIGDASSLPTSKTAAAITGQTPVLVHNLLQALEAKSADATYNGYTSCPLLTEYGKVLLAEFVYGAKPQETFAKFGINQGEPQRAFYYLKKDFFPWVYYNSMVKGTWGGPKGFLGKRSFTTSVRQLRNTPARHPRDPLDASPLAVRYPLPTGETFIVRPPPSQTSSRVLVKHSEALFNAAKLASDTEMARLPPQLDKHHRQARNASHTLDEQQIVQMQQLRQQNPFEYTAGKLAKQFGCSPTFVSIVAPAPKRLREARRAEDDLKKATWGLRKRISRAQRSERRALW